MKIADIEVGAEYGYASWKGAKPVKSKVLAKGVERTYYSHAAYRNVTKRDGIRLEIAGRDGLMEIVTSGRDLVGPWAPIAEQRRAERQSAIQALDRGIAERAKRAKVVLELERLFEEGGYTPALRVETVFAPSYSYVGAERIAQEAAEAGFHVFDDPIQTWREAYQVVTRHPALLGYWLNGGTIALPVEALFTLADIGHVDPDAS
jgi:hypothetical protein